MEISTIQAILLLTGAFVAVNAGSALSIWLDKRSAVRGKWRIREETLLIWALTGGWPGGIWAMRRFRHKTSKSSFIGKYVLAVGLNLAATAVIAYAVFS